MLLSAGIIAYLGAFTTEFRSQQLAAWAAEVAARSIPCSPHFSFIGALGDPVKVRGGGIGLGRPRAGRWERGVHQERVGGGGTGGGPAKVRT